MKTPPKKVDLFKKKKNKMKLEISFYSFFLERKREKNKTKQNKTKQNKAKQNKRPGLTAGNS